MVPYQNILTRFSDIDLNCLEIFFSVLIPVTLQYRGHRSCHHSKLQPISEVGCNPGGCIIPNCLSKTVKTLPLSKSSPLNNFLTFSLNLYQH